MHLREFRDLLLSVHPAVYHFESQKQTEYIVWHEVGTIWLMGDGEQAETGMRIAVDYYTNDEYSPIPAQLEQVLADHDELCLMDHAVDFENNNGLIHHALTCEVM